MRRPRGAAAIGTAVETTVLTFTNMAVLSLLCMCVHFICVHMSVQSVAMGLSAAVPVTVPTSWGPSRAEQQTPLSTDCEPPDVTYRRVWHVAKTILRAPNRLSGLSHLHWIPRNSEPSLCVMSDAHPCDVLNISDAPSSFRRRCTSHWPQTRTTSTSFMAGRVHDTSLPTGILCALDSNEALSYRGVQGSVDNTQYATGTEYTKRRGVTHMLITKTCLYHIVRIILRSVETTCA
jgi:hypothetical protein